MRVLENYINGAWTRSSGTTQLDVKNPATGGRLARGAALDGGGRRSRRSHAAQAAFPAWSATPPVQRARYLFKLQARSWMQHHDELAAICTSEHGKTLDESRNDFGRGIENVEHARGHPGADDGAEPRPTWPRASTARPSASRWACSRRSRRSTSRRWCRSGFLPYAIATGNTFVLKPSEQVPLSQERIFELIRRDRPAARRREHGQRRQGRGERVLRPPAHPGRLVRRLERQSREHVYRAAADDRQARAGARRRQELHRHHARRRDGQGHRQRRRLGLRLRRASAASRRASSSASARRTSACARASSPRPRPWCSATALGRA